MYVKQDFHLLFYRKIKKKNAAGLVPLYARLTIDGMQEEMSTGMRIPPQHWLQKEQVFTKEDPDQQVHDDEVARIRTDLKRHFDLVQVKHEVATPEMVIKAYKAPLRIQKAREERVENLGFSDALDQLISRYLRYEERHEKAHDLALPPPPARKMLLELQRDELAKDLDTMVRRGNRITDDEDWEKTIVLAADEYLLNFMQLCFERKRSYTTLEKAWGRKKRLVDFLRHRYEAIDLPLSKIRFRMADQFLTYNITQHKMEESSAMKYVQFMKEVLARALALEWTHANVLDTYRCHYEETDRKWPTPAELEEFRTMEFETPLQEIVRDCYVFGCYTAYAFAELYSFAPGQIIVGIDGKHWADKHRRKTKAEECLPLLPVVLAIIEKYKEHPICLHRGRCLPIPGNVVYNRELKKMAQQIGWKIKLDGHTSRYYFINELAFNNGVKDLKTLAKMAGIKSIKTLMRYLKGNKQAISENMQMVQKKLFHADGTLKAVRGEARGGAKVIALRAVN